MSETVSMAGDPSGNHCMFYSAQALLNHNREFGTVIAESKISSSIQPEAHFLT